MYTIKELTQIIPGDWHIGKEDATVDTLLQDSRKLEKASSTLFFAIIGERLDGHEYIRNMCDAGVLSFVVQNEELVKNLKGINYVVVKNSLEAIQRLTAHHRQQFNIPIVGITGSNGKTIVKEWCHQMLHEDFSICRSPKSYNSQLGVPLSVWGLKETHSLGVFEAGISEPGEMDRLQKIIDPNIGIFTTIGAAHGENFIHESHKIKEKLKLFLKADVLIYNTDVSILHQNIRGVFANNSELAKVPELLTWGENEESTIRVIAKEPLNGQTRIRASYNKEKYNFLIPFLDTSSVQNAMHCAVLMLYLGFKEDHINDRLHVLQRVAMRLEQKEGINNSTIINDSYNSDIDSLKIALDFLQQQKHKQRKTVILSDILQSGMTGVDLYTSVNDLLIKNEINRFVAIGESIFRHQFVFQADNFSDGLFFYPDTKTFIQNIHDEDFGNETILLKGARKYQFESISAALEEKAHATVLEIDLNAVLHNFKLFNAKLNPGVKIMAMVKAFSYGVSAVEIAKLLEFHRVDYFGVAYADEGITLRKAGITTPIMVLNPEERSFSGMIKYKLEPEIYSFDLLERFSIAIHKSSFEGKFPIHIDLDTGMKRLGFEPKDARKLGDLLAKNEFLEVQSIFSHLAGSDEAELDDFSQEQISLFEKTSTLIKEKLSHKPLLHIANSNGIVRFKEAHFDMVRLGIGLYGFNETLQNELATVTRLKSSISQIKTVKKGESVGYGRKGKAAKNLKIATIAIGYADGLNRLLSNGVGEVFLCNKKAPIIGNICMDMAMIDITEIPEAKEGDVVEIFGDNISVVEIAEKINTIPYEVLTSISERVKRVFYVD